MNPAQPDLGAVRRHFGQAARGYHRASTRWPWAWLRDREAAALLALVGPVDGRRLLERGARDAVVVDLSAPMVAQASGGRTLGVVADAASVSLRRRFDLVVVAGLLEFVGDPAAVLGNAAALASPGAVLAVLVPVDGPGGRLYRAYHQRHGFAIRLYTTAGLAVLAGQAGWRIEATRAVWPYTVVARLSLGAA